MRTVLVQKWMQEIRTGEKQQQADGWREVDRVFTVMVNKSRKKKQLQNGDNGIVRELLKDYALRSSAVHITWDICDLSALCKRCDALHWSVKRLGSSIKQSPWFSNFCWNGKYQFSLLSEQLLLLHQSLASSETDHPWFTHNIRKDNSTLCMGAVTANCVSRRQVFYFNPIISIHGRYTVASGS